MSGACPGPIPDVYVSGKFWGRNRRESEAHMLQDRVEMPGGLLPESWHQSQLRIGMDSQICNAQSPSLSLQGQDLLALQPFVTVRASSFIPLGFR